MTSKLHFICKFHFSTNFDSQLVSDTAKSQTNNN